MQLAEVQPLALSRRPAPRKTRKRTTYHVGTRRAAPRLPRTPGRGLLLLHLPGPPFPRSRLWAHGQTLFRSTTFPGPESVSKGLPVPRAQTGRARAEPPCSVAAATARPLRPSPRAPGLELESPRSSLRPACAEPRPHSPVPAGCRRDRTACSPVGPGTLARRGQSLGTTASGDLGTGRKREQRDGTTRARIRTQAEVHMRRTAAAVRLLEPTWEPVKYPTSVSRELLTRQQGEK
ncbi:uncharacterized protein LOC131819394 [Mustela lutreola]|uniref:uncharacterized protein LOC131819394 n=1 Tax=Mustela lutreola TaxID=9666 RepID=UPI0027977B6B|nr:uncharacterized protein LOC131819394 [Mustela lutreola]